MQTAHFFKSGIREYATYSLFLFMAFFLWTCEEETESLDIDFGYEYYPLQVGQERIFAVDSIIYGREGTQIDSSSGFIREYISAETDGKFEIERYYRSSADQDWVLQGFFSAERTESQAIRKEDNLSYLKLIFPVLEDYNWNPTSFFNPEQNVVVAGDPIEFFKGWEGSIQSMSGSQTIEGNTFDDVLTVKQADLENLIELRRIEEQYAPNVGLIYRQLEILDTQCRNCCNGDTQQCLNLDWSDKAEQGLIITERLIAF